MDLKKLALAGGLLVSAAAAAAPADAYDQYWRYDNVYRPYRSYNTVSPYPIVRGYVDPYYNGYYDRTYYNNGLGFYYPNSRGERIAGRILEMIF